MRKVEFSQLYYAIRARREHQMVSIMRENINSRMNRKNTENLWSSTAHFTLARESPQSTEHSNNAVVTFSYFFLISPFNATTNHTQHSECNNRPTDKSKVDFFLLTYPTLNWEKNSLLSWSADQSHERAWCEWMLEDCMEFNSICRRAHSSFALARSHLTSSWVSRIDAESGENAVDSRTIASSWWELNDHVKRVALGRSSTSIKWRSLQFSCLCGWSPHTHAHTHAIRSTIESIIQFHFVLSCNFLTAFKPLSRFVDGSYSAFSALSSHSCPSEIADCCIRVKFSLKFQDAPILLQRLGDAAASRGGNRDE